MKTASLPRPQRVAAINKLAVTSSLLNFQLGRYIGITGGTAENVLDGRPVTHYTLGRVLLWLADVPACERTVSRALDAAASLAVQA